MFSSVFSVALCGLEGTVIRVEADVRNGLPTFSMVGYLSTQVREAEERVRSAMANSGFSQEPKRITVNFSPADIRKEGTSYDLAVAVAVLSARLSLSEEKLQSSVFIGELSLSGELCPVAGILPKVLCAREAGFPQVFLAAANAHEAAICSGIRVLPFHDLSQVISYLADEEEAEPDVAVEAGDGGTEMVPPSDRPDFSDVHGQESVKRAMMVAAAGRHAMLMVGSAGAGKTMLARAFPGILPPLTEEEQMEVTRIASVAGLLSPGQGMITERPFRAPHHTISPTAMAGGGSRPKAGEITLAHRGVLFLDELAEFPRGTLQVLRQPLEQGMIRIDRLQGSVTYPADFQLLAAMNPCACGFYPDRKRCSCNELQVRSYLGKLSRPFLDRFDLFVWAKPVSLGELAGWEVPLAAKDSEGMTSAEIRELVVAAQEREARRFQGEGIRFNAQMSGKQTEHYCRIRPEDRNMLATAFAELGISARGYHRILRVARTIADLRGGEEILSQDLAEAIGYRQMLDTFFRK